MIHVFLPDSFTLKVFILIKPSIEEIVTKVTLFLKYMWFIARSTNLVSIKEKDSNK